MGDKRLDELIEEAMPALPPDEVARGVTPWRRAMRQIVCGLALTTVTFGHGFFYYVLPFAGTLLLLCGFRTLRRANAPFAWCFYLTCACTAAMALSYALSAVLPMYRPERLAALLPWAVTAARLLTYLALWRALCRVRASAGQTPSAPAALGLSVLYALVIVFGLTGAAETVAALMLALYAVLLLLLWRMVRDIGEAGYELRPAAVRLPGAALAAIVAAATLLCIALGLALGDKYPMEWQAKEAGGEAELRAELAGLGFPEDILADLTDEEVRSFAGAEYVLVGDCDGQPGGGRVNGTDFEMLRLTHVVVRLPGEEPVWRVVLHFNWLDGAGFYGTEAFQAWLGDHYIGLGFAARGPYSGRVLYDADGGTLSSDYYSLADGSETVESVLGAQDIHTLTGRFSFPDGGENQRGYLIYTQYRTEPMDADTYADILAQPHYLKVLSPYAYPASDILAMPVTGTVRESETYGYAFEDFIHEDLAEREAKGVG